MQCQSSFFVIYAEETCAVVLMVYIYFPIVYSRPIYKCRKKALTHEKWMDNWDSVRTTIVKQK